MPLLTYIVVGDNERDREFDSIADVEKFLRGHRPDDFEWITLYETPDSAVIDGYINCLEYCHNYYQQEL